MSTSPMSPRGSSRVRLRFTAVTCGALLMMLAACSGTSQENPAATAESFLHAMGEQDAEAACLLASDDGQPVQEGSAGFKQCVGFFTMALGSGEANWGALAEATVTQATLSEGGTQATVDEEDIKVPGSGDLDLGDLTLVKIEEKWYVDALDEN